MLAELKVLFHRRGETIQAEVRFAISLLNFRKKLPLIAAVSFREVSLWLRIVMIHYC